MPTLAPASDIKTLMVRSTAFENKGPVPVAYTCDGKNVNPPLQFDGIRTDAISLAIIMDDPDAPLHTWVHWLIWDIPVTHHLEENTTKGIQGINDFKKSMYSGPCPMSGSHRYVWRVFALDTTLKLKKGSTRKELESAMAGHVIGYGELTGIYKY
jgi:Raf kinase inhibitor-like YbhB/YbcL family protein